MLVGVNRNSHNISDDKTISDVKSLPSPEDIVFEFKSANACGKLAVRNNKYILLADSTLHVSTTETFPKELDKIRRREYLNKGLIHLNRDNYLLYLLKKDLIFDSPDDAASMVAGLSIKNGMSVWKYNGSTLKDILDQQKTNSHD